MAKKRHKRDTKEFGELTYGDQAKSVTASLNNLFNAVEHHIAHSPRRAYTRRKCRDQVRRFLNRVLLIP